MRVEILYFEGCPNHKPAVARTRAVLEKEDLAAEISEIAIPNEEAAKVMEFLGSPTIRINGVDIEPAARSSKQVGFACRRYAGGLPSEDMIRNAVLEARGQAR